MESTCELSAQGWTLYCSRTDRPCWTLNKRLNDVTHNKNRWWSMWQDAHLTCVCVSVPWRSTSDNISCELQAGSGKALWNSLRDFFLCKDAKYNHSGKSFYKHICLTLYFFFIKFQLLFPSVMVVVESIKSQKVRIVYRSSSPGNVNWGRRIVLPMLHKIKTGQIGQPKKVYYRPPLHQKAPKK